ncbi:MAG: Cys-tRNA(Pro) deacylase [Synergistales bacterium]
MKKTNAARQLDRLGLPYRLVEYAFDENDLGAVAVAEKVGIPLERVFKTLVVRGDKTGVFLAVVPGDAELDLKSAAELTGNKRCEPVHLKEVLPLTGYQRGGVSPLGAKKNFPVIIDLSAFDHVEISVSAGLRGLQMFLNPEDLVCACKATSGALTRG